MFCKTCGSLLQLEKTSYGSWLRCREGHSQPEVNQEQTIISSKNKVAEKITVGDGENFLAVHDHICKKCGYDKAEMLEIGAFYSDEDSVVKMKCGKCGVVEQLEGKVK